VSAERLRVSLYGDGQVNRNVAAILRRRSGYDVLGPYDRGGRDRALRDGTDVVVIATTSFLTEIADDVRAALTSGSNVITTAEEAAFPWAVDASLAGEFDELARREGVTGLGCGLNPGLAFDALVLTAAGAAWEVERIRVQRSVDLSRFSSTILRRLGVGYEPAEFAAGVREGTIHGHIGFPQSMRIVAGAVGVELERIDRQIEPIYARHAHATADMSIPPGATAGFTQRYTGIVGGRGWYEAVFTGHVDPVANGTPPRDQIDVLGTTPLHLVVEPGFDPQTGSSAMIANSIRRLVAARPGWLTVAELPPAHPG
jgi:2,4-diaminopentanoate dehydrogenase